MHVSPDTKFRVIGVDLAAQAKNTAYCEIVVNPLSGTARVEMPKSGDPDASDEALLEAFSRPDVSRIGIDAPFGWPTHFAATVYTHGLWNRCPASDSEVYGTETTAVEYRNLKYRQTDLDIWRRQLNLTKNRRVKPLSVVADLISSVAIRNARLLARAETEHGLQIDRSGACGGQKFVEVYPAAAFSRWNLQTRRVVGEGKKAKSYKKNKTACEQLARTLVGGLPGLHGAQDFPRDDHDALDALAAALVALMVEIDPKRDQGFIEPIPAGMEAVAKREGWIALPRMCSLTRLRHWLSEQKWQARTVR